VKATCKAVNLGSVCIFTCATEYMHCSAQQMATPHEVMCRFAAAFDFHDANLPPPMRPYD